MALNSSGPISLAGTTAGQSIELENGGNGTTQISLNDTAVRSLAGVPSGAITMPTNFWGKSNSVYWVIQRGVYNNDYITSNSAGVYYKYYNTQRANPTSGYALHSYTFAPTAYSGRTGLYLTKGDGTTVISQYSNNASNTVWGLASGTNYSADRIPTSRGGQNYALGYATVSSSGYSLTTMRALNAYSVPMWQACIGTDGAVYSMGVSRYSKQNYFGYLKIADGGGSATAFIKTAWGGDGTVSGTTVLSTDNQYLFGLNYKSSPGGTIQIYRVNTTANNFTLVSTGDNNNYKTGGIYLDASNNVYTLINDLSSLVYIRKYTSSGTNTIAKSYNKFYSDSSSPSPFLLGYGAYLYVIGPAAGYSDRIQVMAVNQSDLTVAWSKTFTFSTTISLPNQAFPNGVGIATAQGIYFSANVSNYCFDFKIPLDGNVSSVVVPYGANNLTITPSTLSVTTGSIALINVNFNGSTTAMTSTTTTTYSTTMVTQTKPSMFKEPVYWT